jgi:succinate dehydrogenase/fumarate reductase-like Fe-S protein
MKTVSVAIQRGVPDEPARTDAFDVPYSEGMSVLDALIWIRNNADPSLAFRYSCINANACKECVLKVDGKTAYACTARLGDKGATVGPLTNKPLIRDLVTDTAPPKERLAAAAKAVD